MQNRIITYILAALSFIAVKSSAQDFHFSQYNENSSIVNPALTGSSSVLKASVIYRDQWRTVSVPYKTYGVNIETRFKANSWEAVEGRSMTFTKKSFNRVAGGLAFYSDNAGDGNLKTTQVNVSLATFVPLNKYNRLSLGLQGSMVQRKLDFSNLVFSNQYNGTTYDAAMASGENGAAQSFIYADFGAGLNWNYTSDDKMMGTNKHKRANVGFAVYHLNRPSQSYLVNSSPKINMKYVVHGDFSLGVKNTNVAIVPSYMLQLQATNYEAVAGTYIKYYFHESSKYTGFNKSTSVSIGAFYRYLDAVILAVGYDLNQQFGIGISYDMNVSGLTKASKVNGGPEIVLRYHATSPYLYQKKAK